MSTWIPAYLQEMAAYIKNRNVWMYGRWNQPAKAMEGGVDLSSSGGTPVFALGSGKIVGLGYFCHGGPFQNSTPACANGRPGYGVVTIRGNIPGFGVNDLYYQHIKLNPNLKIGDTVQRGQLLGSVVPGVNEVEMGVNAQWGTIWGTNHPGPWATDPRPMILALMNQGAPAQTGNLPLNAPVGVTLPNNQTSTLGNNLNGFNLGNLFNINPSGLQQFMLAVFGGVIILVGIIVLFLNSDTGKKTTKVAVEAAAV